MAGGVAAVVLTVRVEFTVPLAAGVTDAGARLHVTVAFTGAIVQERATAELKLFKEVTVMVVVVLLPTDVVPEAGAALKLKLLTDTAKNADRVCPPETPLTVTV